MLKRYLADKPSGAKGNVSTSPKRAQLSKTSSQPQLMVRQSANTELTFKTRSKILGKAEDARKDSVLLSADLISKLRQVKAKEALKAETMEKVSLMSRQTNKRVVEQRRESRLLSHTETLLKSDFSKVKFSRAQAQSTQSFEKQLFVASKNNDLAGISRLLKREVEAEEGNFPKSEPSNHTIAHYAAWHGQEKVVEFLLRTGFNFDAANSDGITPLMLACSRESTSISRILCSMTQNVNAQDCDGKTALHYATEKGFLPMFEILLDHPGIDLEVRNSAGKTAIDDASPEIARRARQVRAKLGENLEEAARIDIPLEESEFILDGIDFRKELKSMPQAPTASLQSDYYEDGFEPIYPPQLGLSARSLAKPIQPRLYNETMKIFRTQERNGTLGSSTSSLSKDNSASDSFQAGKNRFEPFAKKPHLAKYISVGQKPANSKQAEIQQKIGQNPLRYSEDFSRARLGLANAPSEAKGLAGLRRPSKRVEFPQEPTPSTDGSPKELSKLRGPQVASSSLNGLFLPSKSKGLGKQKPANPAMAPPPLESRSIDFSKKSNFRGEKEISTADSRRKSNAVVPGRLGIEDFVIHSVIGSGSFGDVYLVEKKDLPMKYYAMKVLDKKRVREERLNRYVLTERRVLSLFNHPFITRLQFAFQNAKNLFLIMDYYPGGNLADYLFREHRFTEQRARIYVAEIILAIEELHRHNIIYRDLKPENIVLDSEGHALLIDFGLSKEGVSSISRGTKSFCGSSAYLAPEMLKKRGHGKSLDWYLLGVVLYEFLSGESPFYSDDQTELFKNIESEPLKFKNHLSFEAIDLISKLMVRDPLYRLGSQEGASEIKAHPWFGGLDWALVRGRRTKPEKPKLRKMRLHQLRPSDHGLLDVEGPGRDRVSGWTFIGAPPDQSS